MPTLIAVIRYLTPPASTGRFIIGSPDRSAISEAFPMPTATRPLSSTVTRRLPEAVFISNSGTSAYPRRSRNRAAQRSAFPQVAPSLPSELKMRIPKPLTLSPVISTSPSEPTEKRLLDSVRDSSDGFGISLCSGGRNM